MLPFTREQFFGIFVDYNADVGPVQVIAYLIGIGLVSLLAQGPHHQAGDPSRIGTG